MSVPTAFKTSKTIPLGTAAWLTRSGDVLRHYRTGDFFLGHLPSGEAVGFHDDRHALVVAGTRSGKGVSLIIPNLVVWPGSMVVIDPKGENAKVTARRRGRGSQYCQGRGQATRILDPFGEARTAAGRFSVGDSFNPLDMIRINRDESVDIAARIAESLIVSENTNDPIWDNSAKDLLKGVILHVASSPDYAQNQRNLVTVQILMRVGDRQARTVAELVGDESASAMVALFEAMENNKAFFGVVAGIGAQFKELAASPRTLAGVLQVVRVNLGFMDSPGMRRCLASSSFALADLKTLPGGLSLYICLPQRFMETHCRWLRMMTELIVAEMEQVRGKPVTGHPVLMVLDEFPALKRMRVLENAAAQIAGYGVKLMFVVQTLPQLKDIYKDNWETFIANAGVKLFFCNDDHFTRKYASDLIGDIEVTRTARTVSETSGESWSDGESDAFGTSSGGSGSYSSGSNGGSFSSGYNFGSSRTSTLSHTGGGSFSRTEGVNESIQKRALVTPDEIGRIFGDRDKPKALVLISGYQPLVLVRAPYFKDMRWAGFYDAHPDHPRPLTVAQAAAKRQALAEQRKAALAESERVKRAKMAEDERARISEEKDRLVQEFFRAVDEQERKQERDKQREKERQDREFRDTVRRCVIAGILVAVFSLVVWLAA